jgi:hypothetical protein
VRENNSGGAVWSVGLPKLVQTNPSPMMSVNSAFIFFCDVVYF